MTRLVKEDFSEFESFLSSFSFSAPLASAPYMAAIKLMHGKFLALLALVGELNHTDGAAHELFIGDYSERGSHYLGEVLSDCAESLICIAIGASRAGACSMRSAIESFSKAMSLAEMPDVLTCTSVPEVFSLSGAGVFFSGPTANAAFLNLKSAYSELNRFVHTVSPESMFGVPAVGQFPSYTKSTTALSNRYARIVRLFLLAFVGARRDLFDQFDHRNRDLITAALTRDQRRLALG
jgi:hypothetical protein